MEALGLGAKTEQDFEPTPIAGELLGPTQPFVQTTQQEDPRAAPPS